MKHFYLLEYFPLTTKETEVNYDHQKLNIRVGSRVAKRLKT